MAKRKKVSQLERTAYHEAGHAFVALELKVPFSFVTIDPDEDTLGRVIAPCWLNFDPSRLLNEANRKRVEALIMTVLAGEMSEYLRTGRHGWSGARQDLMIAVSMACVLYPDLDVSESYLHFLQLQVEKLLRLPQSQKCVTRIAQLLLHTRTVSSKEVRRQVRGIQLNCCVSRNAKEFRIDNSRAASTRRRVRRTPRTRR